MFPQAKARIPAVCNIFSTIWVTVVLPLVPVMQIHLELLPHLSFKRQARSTSVQTGIPRSTAFLTRGLSGLMPGDTIKSSGAKTLNSSKFSSIVFPIEYFTPNTLRISRCSASALSARTRTSAPSSTNVSVAANPLTPKPKTKTLVLDQSACQLFRRSKFMPLNHKSTQHRTDQSQQEPTGHK